MLNWSYRIIYLLEIRVVNGICPETVYVIVRRNIKPNSDLVPVTDQSRQNLDWFIIQPKIKFMYYTSFLSTTIKDSRNNCSWFWGRENTN